ncbi:MAG: DUF427 domain-containing protein [Acidimicrobiia bacterium]
MPDRVTPSRGRVHVEDGPKRVRVFLDGVLVADTTRVKLVYEVPYYPQYYFPIADVRTELLEPTATVTHSPSRGDASHFTVVTPRGRAVDAARRYPDSSIEELRDLVRFDFDAMQWFEEDEEIFVHPRNPTTRIDILDSSRHVEVRINGVTVADSHRPRLLFETGLPTRYYLPKVDVRMDLLEATSRESACPYKGTARYWSVRVDDELVADVAWSYPTPLRESERIAGLVCFFNERVDLVVDGVPRERPTTKFS